MSETHIRSAETSAELDTLRLLLREYAQDLTGTLGAENMNMYAYEEELGTLPFPYETLLLAYVDQHAAGCVLLKAILRKDEKACELKRLWVRRQFRGLGIGRKLTESAVAQAKRGGYTAMYLDTVPVAMQGASRIYQELGFEPIDRYNDNPVSNLKFFRRSLL